MLPMHLCILIGQRSGGFEKTFLISGVVLLLPAVAYSFGVGVLQITTPLSFISDGNILLSGSTGMIRFVFWIALSLLALVDAKRNWCRVS